jgi:hypothetical protein
MKKKTLPLLCAVLLFGSCVGASMEIVLRPDGSGTIALEYRLAKDLESLGKLDGNENWPVIPVGKADFERSAARIEGLSLRSFSEKTTAADRIFQAKLEFAAPDALLRFMDDSGQTASLDRDGGRNRLALSFANAPGLDRDPQLRALLAATFEGYALDFGITLPRQPELRVGDGRGGYAESPSAGTALLRGNRVSFSAPMAELLGAPQPVRLEIVWPSESVPLEL